jgi:D-beta-D-heptose 7-phosphate kinase / D-beta-D-heptose 1-phosphate adenosyltransferase
MHPSSHALLQRLGRPSLLIVGDVLLDRYHFGSAERISPEAPVPVLWAQETEARLGGAGAVAAMLTALEAEVTLCGVVGDDTPGDEVEHLLGQRQIGTMGLLRDATRTTTVKTRFIGRAQNRHPQQLLRVDHEQRVPLSEFLQERLLAQVADWLPRCAALLVSDYDKGICTASLSASLVELARAAGKPLVVDPPRAASLTHYCGATCMTPNRAEVTLATGLPADTPERALAAGAALLDSLGLEAVVVTLDKDGMALAHRDGRRLQFPTRPRNVYDVTGAGDMVLSVLGLCLAEGVDYAAALPLGNVAGGLAVEQLGTVTLTRHDLRRSLLQDDPRVTEKLVSLQDVLPLLREARTLGRRIVFTNGCFDLLHVGHVRTLQAARAYGDILVVGLNSDESVRRLKGPSRPLQSLEHRAELLAALACVSYIIPFNEDTPLTLIQAVQPDILAKGGDYVLEHIVGRAEVEAAGGKVVVLPYYAGHSTTQLASALASPCNDS